MNKVEKFAREFSNFVNGASREDLDALAKEITSDHRTLQQCSMQLFMRCIVRWKGAYEAGYFDGRNDCTVKLSRDLLKGIDEADHYLPYI